jgi:hypothetical protein
MTFRKGQSGNPGGRPKVALPDGRTLADVCRDYTIDAVEVLINVMGDDEQPAAARVTAAGNILDRGWGKPKQDLGLEVTEDAADLIAMARARVMGIEAPTE